MLFRPVLEYEFKVGTYSYCFILKVEDILVEEEFEAVGYEHEVEDQILILWVI